MKNIGGLDQKIRMVLAAFLALIAFETDTPISWLCLSAALILVITAWFRFCPIWKVFGLNTSGNKK